MKRLIVLAGLTMLMTGCKKKLTQFYIYYNSTVIVQSAVGQAVPFNIYTPEMETNSEAEFESNNTRKDKIEPIFLDQLKMTITSPQGETFSFLNSVEIFISSPNNAEEKIAFKENIPSNIGSELACDLVSVDLQKFVKDDTFRVRVRTITDEVIPQDVEVNLYTNFFVDAKLLRK